MIIGINGRINSGKDTVGKIIKILMTSPHFTNEAVEDFLRKDLYESDWKIKKFADKLKDIVCILLGCTREQLEDESFKSKELGEEWWYFKGRNGSLIPYSEDSKRNDEDLIKPTPRFLLQYVGTDLLRNQLHPSIWVNALMSEYKSITKRGRAIPFGPTTYKIPEVNIYPEKHWGKVIGSKDFEWEELPNWIITDLRFPNELEAIKKRGGITIRVNRSSSQYERYLEFCKTPECTYGDLNSEQWPMSFGLFNRQSDSFKNRFLVKEHESETALDKAEFDYEIDNNKDIVYLISEVRKILEKENLI